MTQEITCPDCCAGPKCGLVDIPHTLCGEVYKLFEDGLSCTFKITLNYLGYQVWSLPFNCPGYIGPEVMHLWYGSVGIRAMYLVKASGSFIVGWVCDNRNDPDLCPCVPGEASPNKCMDMYFTVLLPTCGPPFVASTGDGFGQQFQPCCDHDYGANTFGHVTITECPPPAPFRALSTPATTTSTPTTTSTSIRRKILKTAVRKKPCGCRGSKPK